MKWEAEFLRSLSGLRCGFMDAFMKFFSFICDYGWFLISVVLILLINKKTRRIGIEAAVTLIFTALITNVIIKGLVHRVRPYEAYDFIEVLTRKPFDSSFPSGHTSNSFAVAVAVFIHNKKIGIPLIILSTGIAFSRLYNGVHYPTDVLAGIVIGVTVPIVVHIIMKRIMEKKEVK